MLMLTIVIVTIVILLVLPLYVMIHGYNEMIRRRNFVDEADSGVHVQLKKRYDLIPNLISAVKQYMQHENDLLEKLTSLRVEAIQAQGDVKREAELNGELSQSLRSLMIAVENYPDLKASDNFLHLQESLLEVESQIAAARRNYNNSTARYNNIIQVFPTNFIAKKYQFEPREYLEFDSVIQNAPNVGKLFDKP